MMDKKEERKIRIKDLKQVYENLENSDDDLDTETHIWSKELQSIKNAIKFLEEDNGK